MNFGSKFVYVYDESDEDSISDSGSDTGYGSAKHRDKLVFGSGQPPSDSDDDSDEVASYAAVDSMTMQTDSVASAGFGSRMKKMLSFKKKKKKKSRSAAGIRRAEPMCEDNDLSHDGEVSSAGPAVVPPPRLPSASKVQRKTKKVRKADPNVLTISVGEQVTPVNLHTNAKRICCGNCKAVLPSFSQFEPDEENCNWPCEFCNHFNRDVDATDWTKPASDDVTFVLEAPTAKGSKERKLEESHNVIFVVDISGSMSTTKTCEHRDSSGRRTMTFVSRLDAVKRAAEHQITLLHRESPNVRVGLITFGSEVIIYGDGTAEPKRLSDKDIYNQNILKGVAGDFPPLKPLKETYNSISAAVSRLDIKGMTALGPGLLSAISLAANVKGSKVIICTDGCANLGFGTLPSENCEEEWKISESRAVYRSFGDYAKENSVSVSVISLEGTDCRLVHLGLVAQITGGIVDIVDPADMNAQFGNILASKVLATDVTVTLCLHHSLYIRDFQTQQQRSVKVERFGNVSADTELVIEFGVKTITNENEEPITIADEDREEVEDQPQVSQASVISSNSNQGANNLSGDSNQGANNLSGDGNQGANNLSGDGNQGANNQSGDSNQGNQASAGNQGTNNVSEGSNQAPNNLPGTSGDAPADEGDFATLMQPTDEMDDTSAENTLSELPFQLQIEFSRPDGGKYLRVITNLRECTKKREAAESEMNMNIVGQATSNTISNVALAGNYVAAKHAVKSRKKMTQRFAGQLQSDGPVAASARHEAVEYMDDLNDLDDLVTQQERKTKQQERKFKSNAERDRRQGYTLSSRPPPHGLQHDGAGFLAHDGPSFLAHDGPTYDPDLSHDGESATMSAPPPFHGFGSMPSSRMQAAGMPASLSMGAPPPPPQSAGIGTAGAVNAIPDDLAFKYYARSKGAYKKKQQS